MAFQGIGSKGSFVKDIDGNTLLDLCSTDNLALGHNHDSMLKMVNSLKFDLNVINAGCEAQNVQDKDFAAIVANAFGPIAPGMLSTITLTGGKNATEHAVMHALSVRGATNGKVLGFSGANHGHSLSMTQFAHPAMSASSLGWPSIVYPSNASDEARALE